jgi:hypothetical protein
MYNLYYIEKVYFVIYAICAYFIIAQNPINLIPLTIYTALFHIPLNLLILKKKKCSDEKIESVEFFHRIASIGVGLIPLLTLVSEPVQKLLEFKDIC